MTATAEINRWRWEEEKYVKNGRQIFYSYFYLSHSIYCIYWVKELLSLLSMFRMWWLLRLKTPVTHFSLKCFVGQLFMSWLIWFLAYLSVPGFSCSSTDPAHDIFMHLCFCICCIFYLECLSLVKFPFNLKDSAYISSLLHKSPCC